MTTQTIRRATLTALVFTALAGSALAETAPPPGQGPGPRAERGHERHGMHRWHNRWQMGGMAHMLGFAEMRPGMKIEFSEGRLAFLKAELKITDAQSKAWDAFAAAMRDNAAKLNEVFGNADREAMAKMNPAERLGWQETALAARLDAVKRSRAAFGPLYATFSDDQKKTLERLMPSPGARWMAMRDRFRQRMEERRERRGNPPGEPRRQQ
jgi:hypothetical protein